MKIITIGEASFQIGLKYSLHSACEVLSIDSERKNNRTIVINEQNSAKEYERNFAIDLDLLPLGEEIFLFVSDGSKISGITLSLLAVLISRNNRINLIQIQTEKSLMTKEVEKHSVIFNKVLKDVALSGYIERLLIFNNQRLINLVRKEPGVNFINLYSRINELISWYLFLLYEGLEGERLYGSKFNKVAEYARIETLGVLNLETFETVLFAEFKQPRSKHFFIFLNKEDARNTEIANRIINNIRKTEDQMQITFTVHSTMDRSEGLCLTRTSI